MYGQERTGGFEQPLADWSSKILASRLALLRKGRLDVRFPDGVTRSFDGAQPGPAGVLYIHRPNSLVRRVLRRGAVGFAEGYINGDWSTPALAQLLETMAVNQDYFEGMNAPSALGRLRLLWTHWRRRNSRRGSRRNIAAHYDLGNDFYRLWLDPGMTYSSGIYASGLDSLDQAQQQKYARILDQLDARPGQHILEIGCGWGGFAVEAARRGLRVTGLTLSREQLRHARQRIRVQGLEDLVELRLQDYRDLDERFDHIVSIEMFEAVGEQYWPTYFNTLKDCLRPGGKAVLQVITIADHEFESYRRQPDFIQQYIFPGGMLPSPTHLRQLSDTAGLTMTDSHWFGGDYAATLAAWHRLFNGSREELRRLGYDSRFLRTWRYYLAYCEVGFRIGRIDVGQFTLEKE